jgi:hypothetical protein
MPTIHIELKEEEFIDAARAASAPGRVWFLTGTVAFLVILGHDAGFRPLRPFD